MKYMQNMLTKQESNMSYMVNRLIDIQKNIGNFETVFHILGRRNNGENGEGPKVSYNKDSMDRQMWNEYFTNENKGKLSMRQAESMGEDQSDQILIN